MRIAYVCADLGVPVFGRKGCSIHVQEVVRALSEQGAGVELFARRPEGEPLPGMEAIRVHALPAIPRGDHALRELAALAANDDVRTLLEQEGPFDLVYERYSLWSFAAMEYARAAGIPGLLEVNAPLIAEQEEHRILIDRPGAEHAAERVFAAATSLLAVSAEVAAYLEQYPVARGRVHVVPNGVDPDRFPAGLAPSCPRPSSTFTVGVVGTLKPWHGLTTLIDAFALLRDSASSVRLLIVGDGPERSPLLPRPRRWDSSPGHATRMPYLRQPVAHSREMAVRARLASRPLPFPASRSWCLPKARSRPVTRLALGTGRPLSARVSRSARLLRSPGSWRSVRPAGWRRRSRQASRGVADMQDHLLGIDVGDAEMAGFVNPRLIFDSIDGTISGWNPDVDPTHAILIRDTFAAGTPSVLNQRRSLPDQSRPRRCLPLVLLRSTAACPAEVNPPEEACLEVLLSGQRVLRIRPGFDAATLQRLLAVLEPPAC